MGKVTKKIRTRLLFSAIHILALGILLSALLAAVVSQKISPFYATIADTPLEHLGRYIIGQVARLDLTWRNYFARRPMGQDEQKAHEILVERIRTKRPTHAIVLKDGRSAFGTLHKNADSTFLFKFETNKGQTTLPLAPPDLAWSRKIIYAPIELTPQDVRFLLDFPQLTPHHLPPYLIAADVPCTNVMAARDILNELADDFFPVFRYITPKTHTDKLAYVCIFRDEPSYLAYAIQQKSAHLEKSVGFYSQTKDCLYLYNPLLSFTRLQLERSIKTDALSANHHHKQLYHFMLGEQTRTLRHEGTHQLAYSYGLHTNTEKENFWLIEGLAQYCETNPLGQLQASSMTTLCQARENGRLLPLIELINLHHVSELNPRDTDIAYAQAWLLFHTLMQNPHKPRFFQFIRHLQNLQPTQTSNLQSDMLETFLNTPIAEIAMQMNARLSAFAKQPDDNTLEAAIPK